MPGADEDDLFQRRHIKTMVAVIYCCISLTLRDFKGEK